MMTPLQRALLSLEGLSVGDAFGQCFFHVKNAEEHIDKQVLPDAPWYYTDDTEMSLSVISVLSKFGRIDQDIFVRSLAQHYDYDRAYGPSMHRVLERIRNNEPWQTVAANAFEGQGSYGNGAAMRAGPLGAFFADDLLMLKEQAVLSAEVTHAHSEGIAGAIAVALAAAHACRLHKAGRIISHADFLEPIIEHLAPSEVRSKLIRAQSITNVNSQQFAISILGNGIGMSAQDTVPYALWCCGQALDDYQRALWLAVSAGGDRDTLCAIVGSIVTCNLGIAGIPKAWHFNREVLPTWYLDNGFHNNVLTSS